jgi:hypothetical protein
MIAKSGLIIAFHDCDEATLDKVIAENLCITVQG